MSKLIFLTGFMGVGKSTVGQILAQKLSREFSDLDQLIERQEGLKVFEIFQKHGEAYFREKESLVLHGLCRGNSQVIALGGGAFLKESHREEMKKSGLSIYLKASFPVLCERLRGQDFKQRPLLQQIDVLEDSVELQQLLKQREGFYEQADWIISTDGKSPQDVALEIYSWIKDIEAQIQEGARLA